MFLNSLSGRFLILTTVFVMLAEVLIFVPSVARFREDYLLLRLEKAQIASLALLADDMIDPELEQELLGNAGVFNVVLRRDEVRQLILSSPIPSPITETFDLRDPSAMELIRDAMMRLASPGNDVIRVIGNPVREAGLLIEVTMDTRPAALCDDRLWSAHPAAVGGHFGLHRDSAVPGGAPVPGQADQGRRRGDDLLCRGARGCAPDHQAHCRGARIARCGNGACLDADPADRSPAAERNGWRNWAAPWPRSATICATS